MYRGSLRSKIEVLQRERKLSKSNKAILLVFRFKERSICSFRFLVLLLKSFISSKTNISDQLKIQDKLSCFNGRFFLKNRPLSDNEYFERGQVERERGRSRRGGFLVEEEGLLMSTSLFFFYDPNLVQPYYPFKLKAHGLVIFSEVLMSCICVWVKFLYADLSFW